MVGYVGLKIDRKIKTKNIALSQSGLIDRILEAMRMEDFNPKFNPADKYLSTKI